MKCCEQFSLSHSLSHSLVLEEFFVIAIRRHDADNHDVS